MIYVGDRLVITRRLGGMIMAENELLSRVKSILAHAFGERLQGVVLYGSQARGQTEPDNDIDLLVLLTGPVKHGRDSSICIDALYGLVLELERPIHAMPVDVNDYEAQEFPLYQTVKREGVS